MAVIEQPNLVELMKAASAVEGDVVEIGVYVAETFSRLAPLASKYNKMSFAIDSFCGMGEPTAEDLVSGNQYPTGRLSNESAPGSGDGVINFKRIMQDRGAGKANYECVEGLIPNVFKKFDVKFPDQEFAFVLIDVDHYLPTKHSLSWAWPKINKGGILVLDDYFRDIPELAALGIDEWMKDNLHFMDFKVEALVNTQLFIRKLVK